MKKPKPTSKQTPIAEAELLRGVRGLLNSIQPADRPVGVTGKGRYSPLKTVAITIRIPITLDEELRSLGGVKSWHIERAIMLYLRAMRAEKGKS